MMIPRTIKIEAIPMKPNARMNRESAYLSKKTLLFIERMEQYDNMQEAKNSSRVIAQNSSRKVLWLIPDMETKLMMTKHRPIIFAEVDRI
jgi:hypothetical protein